MRRWAVGVDLGGTKIEVALVNDAGQIVDRLRKPTDAASGPDHIIESICALTLDLLGKNPAILPQAIGVGVAGQIEKTTGAVIFSPNLGWHDVDLARQLTEKLHIPAVVYNDVKTAAWGEWLYGAGLGCDNLLCIFVGTGIGGAIIANGKMIEGCNSTAGEIGHMTLQMDGPLCHCGNHGCFEALASGWAIARDAQQAATHDRENAKQLLEITGGDIQKITAETVAKAAQNGDGLSKKIITAAGRALAAGVTSAVNLLGPCRVILGGGIIEGMPAFIEVVSKETKTHALKAATTSLEILPAKLHNDSGVIGAATFALHQIKN